MMRLINSRALAAGLLGVAMLVPAASAAPDPEDPNGHGGQPTVEKEATTVTFHDSFIQDVCGIATQTTLTQRTTTKTYPDGYTTVHVNGELVPDDPRIASERDAFTDVIEPDGTVTTKGLAIRLYRKGEGTVIRDAGWVRFLEDGLIVRGPHPFLDTDPADVFC